jgi:hypothetical protein
MDSWRGAADHRLVDAKSTLVLFLQTVSFPPLLSVFVTGNQCDSYLQTTWQRFC